MPRQQIAALVAAGAAAAASDTQPLAPHRSLLYPTPPDRRVSTRALTAGAPTSCASAAWRGTRSARSRRR